MTGRVLGLCGLLLCGCLGDEKAVLVPSEVVGNPVRTPDPYQAARAPAGTEATAKRVTEVGRKVLEANRQVALRPVFSTVGMVQPEVFHGSRGPYAGGQVIVTEGLARQCKTDGQLAAVLAMELAKMVVERESSASPSARLADRAPPPDVPVGNDAGGPFGASDGTRYVELAKLDRHRRRPSDPPPALPDPEVLARAFLVKAGYSATDLEDALPLLRRAEQNNALERQMGGPAVVPAGK